jgi:hypothetical protein
MSHHTRLDALNLYKLSDLTLISNHIEMPLRVLLTEPRPGLQPSNKPQQSAPGVQPSPPVIMYSKAVHTHQALANIMPSRTATTLGLCVTSPLHAPSLTQFPRHNFSCCLPQTVENKC